IETYGLEAKVRALFIELPYGTLQHRMTLDDHLEPVIRDKVEDWVRERLRLSAYQSVYLTKIPAHAAVNEAVEIAKRRGHKGIASMVNGILRSFLRKGPREIGGGLTWEKQTSIETSHPEWMIRRWAEQYGRETALEMA